MPHRRFRQEPKAGFICECGESLCDERVSMSGSDYDGSLEPVLAARHGPDHGGIGTCAACGRRQRLKRRRRR